MTEIVDDPTMVERIARAIWMENQPAGAPSYEELDFLDQGRVKMIARACIKEQFEPTTEMIEAGYKIIDGSEVSIPSVWKAMIEAALKED